MNRIQFWILTGLSIVVVALLIAQIFLVRSDNFETNRLAAAQQLINQGQASQTILKQLALRLYQDSQKTQDQGLKDLMTRQQITFKANSDSSNSSSGSTDSSSAPAPSSSMSAPVTH